MSRLPRGKPSGIPSTVLKTTSSQSTVKSASGTSVRNVVTRTAVPGPPQPAQPTPRYARPPPAAQRPAGAIARAQAATPQPQAAIPRPQAAAARPQGGLPRPQGAIPRTQGAGARPQIPAIRIQGTSSTTSATSVDADGRSIQSVSSAIRIQATIGQPAGMQGRYILPAKDLPSSAQGRKQVFSSPAGMRHKMAIGKPPAGLQNYEIMPRPGMSRDRQLLQKSKVGRDIHSGAFQIPPPAQQPAAREAYAGGRPTLDRRIKEGEFDFDTSEEQSSFPKVPEYMKSSELAKGNEQEILAGAVKATGRSQSPTSPVSIVTPSGRVPVDVQYTVEKTVDRSPHGEHVKKHFTGIRPDGKGGATKMELNVQYLDPNAKPGLGGPLRETISVTSSVSMGPEAKQFIKHVAHEVTKTPVSQMKPSEVAQMVAEENAAVEQALKLAAQPLKRKSPEDAAIQKRLKGLNLDAESADALEHVINQTHANDDEQEEMQPEVAAAIMHTEERGLAMASSPAHMYNYLFPNDAAGPLIGISSVAPAPLQDVVIPTSTPRGLVKKGITREVEQAAETSKRDENLPVADIFAGSPNISNIATRGAKKRNLEDEGQPYADDDFLELSAVIGAAPSSVVATSSITEPSIRTDGKELEYIMVPEPPRHFSRVQLRGSNLPPWFPGYYVALSDTQEGIRVTRSPNNVITSAWRAVQPKAFPDNSFVSS